MSRPASDKVIRVIMRPRPDLTVPVATVGHEFQRSPCAAGSYLLPGGGHPHMMGWMARLAASRCPPFRAYPGDQARPARLATLGVEDVPPLRILGWQNPSPKNQPIPGRSITAKNPSLVGNRTNRCALLGCARGAVQCQVPSISAGKPTSAFGSRWSPQTKLYQLF